jgi:hypothetical protein
VVLGKLSAPDETGATPVNTDDAKGAHRVFDLEPLLSSKEAASAGALKLLQRDIQRLNDELDAARPFRDRYHASDKEVGVLQERLRVRTAYEVFSLSMAATSAGLISYGTAIWTDQPTAAVLVVVGGLLGLGSIVAKIARVRA